MTLHYHSWVHALAEMARDDGAEATRLLRHYLGDWLRRCDVRREYGWGGRFVLMYVGTHGMAHALHGVLEVAAMLRYDPSKLFVSA